MESMDRRSTTRIVQLTTVHRRDDIRVFHGVSSSLARAGYEVFLVVGDGKGDASAGGVKIVDVGLPPGRRLARMALQPFRCLEVIRRLSPQLVHFHDPELLPLGMWLSGKGIPVIYDVHEDLPRQIRTKLWIPQMLRGLVAAGIDVLEKGLSRRMNVIAATPHIAAKFSGRVRHCLTVPNYPRPDELYPSGDCRSRERAVCYVGGLSRSRGILNLVRAVGKVPGLKLVLCGAFQDNSFESELRGERSWASVEYLGWTGRARVREVMHRCSAGAVTLLPEPAYQNAMPIKMFEYMSAGLPVIASNFSLWRKIVEENDCGVCVDPENPDAIGDALSRIVDDPARSLSMGLAGRSAVLEKYQWATSEQSLLRMYRSLM